MKELILAIAMIESSMNPLAIGDDGASVGFLQISEPCLQDLYYTLIYGYQKQKKRAQVCINPMKRLYPESGTEVQEVGINLQRKFIGTKLGRS
jgi:hypothetical protein